ncbi:MAG TPA: hypothetical protein VEB66_18240 [Opitutaceae bacterium]|nr:hypothetical protein [Opitutaceae bacterium]
MKKLLASPVPVLLLAVALGAGTGIAAVWRAAGPLVAEAVKLREQRKADAKAQGWDFWTIEIDGLAAELKDERARLRQQAEQLDQRAARLAAEQQELEKVRAEVAALRREIADRVIEIQADEMKNLRALAQTYANLTPRAAVAIIRELDDVIAVKILSLMKADVVGPIFEEMSRTAGPDGLPLSARAARLSEKLRLMKSAKPATPS